MIILRPLKEVALLFIIGDVPKAWLALSKSFFRNRDPWSQHEYQHRYCYHLWARLGILPTRTGLDLDLHRFWDIHANRSPRSHWTPLPTLLIGLDYWRETVGGILTETWDLKTLFHSSPRWFSHNLWKRISRTGLSSPYVRGQKRVQISKREELAARSCWPGGKFRFKYRGSFRR